MIRTITGLIVVLALGAIIAGLVQGMNVPGDLQSTGHHYAENGLSDTGSSNLVTAVIVAYRGLDTLGEVVVLFCASTAVVLILTLYPLSQRASEASSIVVLVARIMPAPVMLIGVYLISHAHLSPGGGFPGGAVISSAFLLVMLGSSTIPGSGKRMAAVESLAGLSFGLLGFWGVMTFGQFLHNRMLGTGEAGTLVSAGIIPLISLAIGAKVASELSSVFSSFRGTGGLS